MRPDQTTMDNVLEYACVLRI